MRLIVATLFILLPASAFADNCKFTAERSVDIDAQTLRALRFELGSSDLHVKGKAGLARIEVRGKACASQEDWLAQLNIAQTHVGDKITVKSTPVPDRHGLSWDNSYAYIDFTVSVPLALALEVDSGSGDAHIDDIAALDFTSGSGDLALNHASGAVVVKVGSGDVEVADVGSFTLTRSGSGDVLARDIHGDVKVGHVGSGDLSFVAVKGAVAVDGIGSGDLNVDQTGGNVSVDSVGSGDVTVDHIGGSLVIKAAGSGDIHHAAVAGNIDIPHRHAQD